MSQLSRYPGVKPFSTKQANIFRGRTSDVEKLVQMIKSEKTVLLYSKSGMGKSSIINAGIIPVLSDEYKYNFFQFRFHTFVKDQTPTPLQTMFQVLGEKQADTFLDKLIPNDNSLWYKFKTKQILTQDDETTLLIFDQFEELFSYSNAEIIDFKKQIAELISNTIPNRFYNKYQQAENETSDFLTEEELNLLFTPPKVKLLFSIRFDRFSYLNTLTDLLPDLTRRYYELKPLNHTQLEEAIVLPAKQEGDFDTEPFFFNKSTVEAIIKYLTSDCTQEAHSTQVQILCKKLEKIADKTENNDRTICENDIPSFKNIFTEFYLECINELPENKRTSTCKFIEEELIKNNRRISLDSLLCLTYVEEPILQKLSELHLIQTERNNSNDGVSYELSHDTLIEPILRMRDQRHMEEAKIEEEKRQAEYLAEQMKIRNEVIAKEQHEKKEMALAFELERKKLAEEKRNRIIRLRIIRSVAFIFFILIVIIGYNYRELDKIQAQNKILLQASTSRDLLLSYRNPTKAIRVAQAILILNKENKAELSVSVWQALVKAFYRNKESNFVNTYYNMAKHNNDINTAEISSNGKLILTASDDNTAILWTKDLIAIKRMTHNDSVKSACFSPDNSLILTTSTDNTAKIWNTFDNKSEKFTIKAQNPLTLGIFSNNGKFIAIFDTKGNLLLFNKEGKLLIESKIHKNKITSAKFSPNDKFLLTASSDSTAVLWNVEKNERIKKLQHQAKVNSIAFSNDNKLLATASDSTAKIWDITGNKLNTLVGHNGEVWSVEFSPNNSTLLTASDDCTAKLWNVKNAEEIEPNSPIKHSFWLTNATFSPDGKYILTSSFDQTAKIWNTKNKKLLKTLEGHTGIIWQAKFFPKQDKILSFSKDNTLRIWNIENVMEENSRRNNIVYIDENIILTTDSVFIKNKVKIAIQGKKIKKALLLKNNFITLTTDGSLQNISLYGSLTSIYSSSSPILDFVISPKKDSVFLINKNAFLEILDNNLIKKSSIQIEKNINSEKINMEISTDGSIALYINNKLLIRKNNQIETLLKNDNDITCFKFNNNGQKLLIGCSNHEIKVENLENKAETFFSEIQHVGSISDILYTNDNKFVISASTDKTIKIWTIEGKLVHTLNLENAEEIEKLVLSGNGFYFYAISKNKSTKWFTPKGIENWLEKNTNNFYNVFKDKDEELFNLFDNDELEKINKYFSATH